MKLDASTDCRVEIENETTAGNTGSPSQTISAEPASPQPFELYLAKSGACLFTL